MISLNASLYLFSDSGSGKGSQWTCSVSKELKTLNR
jgi:hypothetical protein